ncbi:MAG: helix-turn-helix transcriptional regulator [Nitrospinae bacterium]|nr:helix-turn-helix transcriptional regulator [Nitrospinota bacterium]
MVEHLVINIGRKIKQLREERGLSLRQLGELIDVSPSHIQKIETNQINPSITVMLKIARGFGKEISHFLDEGAIPQDVAFLPSSDRQAVPVREPNITIEMLSVGLVDQIFQPMILVIPPGEKLGPREIVHEGEEWQLCLQGTVEFTIRDDKYTLKEGDGLHFKSHITHHWENIGRGEARLLMVCSPPPMVGRDRSLEI